MANLPQNAFLLGRQPLTPSTHPIGFRPDFDFHLKLKPGQIIADASEGHALVLAPTGAGKKRNILAPTLLTARNPCIVLDIKGELARETIEYRADVLGHHVVLLDPWHITGYPVDSLNPIDLIRLNRPFGSTDVSDDAYSMARLLQDQAPLKEAYWDESAQSVIAGLIAHMAISVSEEDRSFRHIWQIANADDPLHALVSLLDSNRLNAFSRAQISGLLNLNADTTRSCILSVMYQHLRIFGSEAVQKATGSTSFDLEMVRQGKPITIYICVPLAKLHSHAALLRLWLGALMDLILTRIHRPDLPTMMLLDELGQLGRMDQVMQAVTLARGYGMRCMLLLQSLASLKRTYPTDWEVLVENCASVATFGHTQLSMSRQMAELSGDIAPEQLFNMSRTQLAVRQAGSLTQVLTRLDYLTDAEFAGLAKPSSMNGCPPVA